MKIYRLYHNVDGYKAVDIKGSELEEELINKGNDAQLKNFESLNLNWSGSDNDRESCFPFIDGSIPVFRSDVFKSIEDNIKTCATSTKINLGNQSFFIVEANVISNVLNIEKSSIRYFKDGRIMNIKKYVFKSGVNYPNAFRISECKTFTFVTDKFMDNISNRGEIEGLNYELCDIV